MTLGTNIADLPKVGPATLKSLHRLDLRTITDLLWYLPNRYLDYSKASPIDKLNVGEIVTVTGVIKTINARRSFQGRLSLTETIVSDDTGSIKVVWFNQPYLAKSLHPGDQLVLSGKVERYRTLQLSNPVYEKLSDRQLHTGRLVPVYRLGSQISSRVFRQLIAQALPLAEQMSDMVTPAINEEYNLLPLSEAIKQLHFPDHPELVKQARLKIAFNDLFPKQLATAYLKRLRSKQKALTIKPDIGQIKAFLATLPFTLTNSQKRASWDILQDLSRPTPMNRLLQGDVGSGKTLVALIAALECARSGIQTTILAPTEILARQHYETIMAYLQGYPHQIGLLTRNFHLVDGQKITRPEYFGLLEDGHIQITVGTHALLRDGIKFKKLGLIVIDEQHRFGVAQRQYLGTISHRKHPHFLSMSATPIPRTLALTILGDLEISTLKALPQGRRPVQTKLVTETERDHTYRFIREHIRQGQQAFIITPRVEESETSELKSAKQEYERLRKQVFPDLKLGLVYGKMKGTDKDEVMTRFDRGELDILVATSVIEIGIDVPNASIILIEGAERFGLAQLHQLRGRVGRGQHQSYCFLFTTEATHQDNERLQLFSKTNDGFALAELDLEQRGFGDMFGQKQTGYDFRFPEFISLSALKNTKHAAEALLQTDPELRQHPETRQEISQLLNQLHTE